MRKRWLWLGVLGGTIIYLCLNPFSFSSISKQKVFLPPATPSKVERSASVYSASLAKEPIVPTTYSDNIQPDSGSYTAKQFQPISPIPVADSFPKVFWGYLRLVDTTFFGRNHALNKAVIEDLVTSREAYYTLNSVLPYGSKLIQIFKDRVVLEKDGMKRSLTVFDSLDNPVERMALLAWGYQRVGQNKWLISSNRLLKDNKNIEGILTEAEITPYLGMDGAKGFQLNRLKQGSLFEELGFREGDVIRGVNGEKLGDLNSVLQTYRKLTTSSLINVRIERGQEPINLSYQMIPDGTPSYSVEEVLQVPSVVKLFGSSQAVNN